MSETQNEHPILKELSNPQKTMSLLGVDLEARQFALLAGLLAPLAVAYRLGLFEWLGLSPAQVMAVAVPFALTVAAFAFLRWEGRELSFFVGKKLQGILRERRLVWRARPPGSVMWLRDSVQRYLPADEPVWDMLKTKNGTYLRVVEIEASSLSLASEEQKERMRARLAEAYTAFDFEVTEITRSRPSAMGTYLARLQDDVRRELGRRDISEEEAIRLRAFGEDHVAHLEGIVAERQAYEHKSFLVLTYKPSLEERRSASPLTQLGDMLAPFVPFLGRRPSRRRVRRAQEEASLAYRKLQERVETAVEYYGRLGLRLRPLGEREALAFIREEAGGANLAGVSTGSGAPAEEQTPFGLGPTVTLTDEQYTRLSRRAIDRRIDAAEEARSAEGGEAELGAPPVVGLGELTVSDRIAPEAVRIESDHLEVGGSYHRTLFVYDLPDKVRVGFLQSLAEMKHRIKIVKYIRPVPTRDALDLIGRKKSQLLAAEKTTSQGNVLEREQKRLARESAELAHREVASASQRYYELSVLIHLEADSLEELDGLTDRVKTRLDEKYVSTRLALEEMFEGYVSCLPFGENHLAEKYCTSGILTDPLSCFSTFSSLEINHARGVLWGTDRNTNAPVLYDDRLVPNRHKIVLGGSGMGKTVLVKALSTRSRLRGETNILIDPEGRTRYERVARHIGGQFVKLGQGSQTRINPFELTGDYPDLERLGDTVDDEEDPQEALRAAREGAFNSKVTTLVSLIGLMATTTDAASSAAGGLSPGLRGKLERVVAEVYADAGIGEDPATHRREPPVMGDFFAKLADRAERDADLAGVRESLYSWEHGSLRRIFDGPTNCDLRSKYLVVRISAGENGPEKAPLMFVLLDFLRGRLADPRESITCFIDEMWSLLKYPMAVELLNQLWRASRASGTSMVGITQDLEEFLASEQATTIMRQSKTYALLGQSKSTIESVSRFVELSERTRQEISNFAPGEALLVAGQRQLPINVAVSDSEKELFHTDADDPAPRDYSGREAAGGPSSSLSLAADVSSTTAVPGVDTAAVQAASGAVAGGDAPEPVPTLAELAPAPSEPADGASGNGRRTGRAGAVYAVGGRSAAEVAFALAGMLSTAATRNETGGRVALVDAQRTLTSLPLFASIPLPATDDLIHELGRSGQTPGGRELDRYLIRDEASGLSLLRHPDRDSVPASGLAEFMASRFDAVLVACGPRACGPGDGSRWPRYAEDWLLSATRVAAAADTPDALARTAGDLADLGEFAHRPLLALAGNAAAGQTDGLPAKEVLSLPDVRELGDSMKQGQFHPIQRPDSGESFARLARRLTG